MMARPPVQIQNYRRDRPAATLVRMTTMTAARHDHPPDHRRGRRGAGRPRRPSRRASSTPDTTATPRSSPRPTTRRTPAATCAWPVPTELGGLGASMRQVVLAEEELGSHSGAAALSAAMHLYLTLVQCWRWRRGAPDAEGVLRKIAADGLVMATSGGSDWVCPSTTAVEVPGGYRLDGRKQFCSQAPVAGVISTSATLGEPGPDAVVLHAGVPLSSPGVSIVETWDTLGMRGTASHDVVFDGVFLPAEKVVGQRPYGVARRSPAGRGDPLRAGGRGRLPGGGPGGLRRGRAAVARQRRARASGGAPDRRDAGAAAGGALGAAGRRRRASATTRRSTRTRWPR